MTPLLWLSHCVFLVLLMLNRRLRGSLCCVMAFFIASYQHLLWTSAHPGPRPLRPGVAFPTTSPLHWNLNSLARTQLPQLPSWLRYIIVQRLHDRPLDLWNRMFNRHQAEITVMQFRSLSSGALVYESIMGYFYLVPFHQTISAHAISSHNWH